MKEKSNCKTSATDLLGINLNFKRNIPLNIFISLNGRKCVPETSTFYSKTKIGVDDAGMLHANIVWKQGVFDGFQFFIIFYKMWIFWKESKTCRMVFIFSLTDKLFRLFR